MGKCRSPWARAHGYNISPLRGWCMSTILFSRKTSYASMAAWAAAKRAIGTRYGEQLT